MLHVGINIVHVNLFILQVELFNKKITYTQELGYVTTPEDYFSSEDFIGTNSSHIIWV